MLTSKLYALRAQTFRQRGYTDRQIDEALNSVGGDPLLDAHSVEIYCGSVSHMTIRRWMVKLGFPKPTIIDRRRYWRRSVVDGWLAEMESTPIAAGGADQ